MSSHVDKIVVNVSGAIEKVSVQSFELSVGVNAIPSITLHALPVIAEQGVTVSDFAKLTSLYESLAKKASTLEETVNVSISIISKVDATQSISLENWILADVGLSSVTTYAAPTLTIVCRHPVCKYQHTGTIYESVKNPGKLGQLHSSLPSSDIISFMDGLYNLWSGEGIEFYQLADPGHGGPGGDIRSKVLAARTQLLTDPLPSKYLTSPGPLFLHVSGVPDKVKTELRAALGDVLCPKPWGDSTWTKIVDIVCSKLIMNVVPTYTSDKLIVEPYNPWQKSSIEFDEERIEAIDMPSTDPDPIWGASNQKEPGVSGLVTGINVRGRYPDMPLQQYCDQGFYFPPKASVKKSPGRIAFFGDNSIVSYAKNIDFASFVTGANTLDTVKNTDGVEDPTDQTINKKVTGAMFNANYRRYCKAAVTGIPTFLDKNGTLIHPGRVCTVSVTSGSGKNRATKQVFYAYLSRMTIIGSADGAGTSYFEMMTARPVTGRENILVDEGAKNMCYA